ncbi:Gfo/Idh/MocA family protein [Cecembia calidifontis]|jgi:predicted dehydrogenase|uniref:Putative dehydrogenase n=1 Tax=Cecembia calidifontis TaxID=1187080 RepID=A0A4Q7PAH4_9BACT|nr:Gfo/Idh/MocA family oxidoreductase [Cecembia calidifontis]RZS96540.1 putative dehydrogenase [Cecembia calidifontis]
MKENLLNNRRGFIKTASITALGLSVLGGQNLAIASKQKGKRVGIIGLDTSHSIAFTKVLNGHQLSGEYLGYHVVAAYPYGSRDIPSSRDRIPGYTEEIQKMGVKVVGSIADLLQQVDVVLLETNDGKLHLEQAMEVFKAGKRMFIDKPITASYADAVKIFEASEKFGIPVFSSSSLRYVKGIEGIEKNKVLGADTFSPATIEPSHPDLYWYGIHGVETLYTVMGTGCESLVRISTENTDVVVGTWKDGRIGTFRGTRTGVHDYGGTVFTTEKNIVLGPYSGYEPLLLEIVKYFETGNVPVQPEETLEILAFMEATDESKKSGGKRVFLDEVKKRNWSRN